MRLFTLIRSAARQESGVVTVDWVVLTAAIVGLGVATMSVVRAGVEDLSNGIRTELAGPATSETTETTSKAEAR